MNISFFNLSDDDDHDEDHDYDNDNTESLLPPTIRFWILLICSIPSIICCLIVLWSLFTNREKRRSLNYRIIIIQLIACLIYLLTNVPLYLNYLRLGYVWPKTPAMCQLWWFVGDGYADTMTILMAWASFERHIFIFHSSWLSTTKKKFFVHYLPVTLIILYCLLYYIVTMGFPPCENKYNYDENQCSLSCLYRNEILSMYDTIFNDILATTLVAIFSISLIIRLFWHNYSRLNGQVQWRRHRKIIFILLSISIIYLLFNLPMMIVDFLDIFDLYEDTLGYAEVYLDFLNYFIFILYPFICFAIISRRLWNCQRRQLIHPAPLLMTNRSRTQGVEMEIRKITVLKCN